MMFGSETFYSLNAAPEWVKVLSHLLPLGYLLASVHAALAGDATGMVLPSLILFGFTILALILAVVTFRWDADLTFARRVPRIRMSSL